MKNNYFLQVMLKGILGAAIGIISGLVLSVGMYLLQQLVEIIFVAARDNSYGTMLPPISLYTTLGMGFGAVLGGMIGGSVGIKEKKDKK